ncbi:PAS domain S-box protein [Sphingomonas sp. R86520]|jgi:two-component system sensor kinase FixL|uniref:PAS domain-containing sensor histidine kinase n=1 Tax=Sphingomonas sp. R86520 TaxID=3093859 RepID=UPI0036D2488B
MSGDRSFTAQEAADATARQNAAMAEELGLLIDGATSYAIYMLDPTGRVTIWNLGAERIKGWTEAEIIGSNFAKFYTPEDAAAGKPADDLARAAACGRIEEESWRMRKDGSEFLASVTITALRNDAGDLRGFGKVIRDITDQKAAEAALVRREHHLRSILATVPDAMIVMGEDGIVTSFSAAAEQVFGYAKAQVVGNNVGMLMPPSEQRDHDDHLRTYLRTGIQHVIGNVRIATAQRANGEIFPIELAVGEAVIAGERIFTGFVRDLTNRQLTERKVKELQSELVHVSRVSAMGTMASTLAHEINQPLTAIANYLETTRAMIGPMTGGAEDGLLGEIAEALDLAAAQSLRAGTIVRRLRAFVDGGDTGFQIERLDELVEEATSLGLLGAHEAGIEVVMTIAAGLDKVRVDRVQIQQVLVNLIRNAIQSMAGSPTKTLTIATAPDRAGWVRVTVADTGAGLDPDIRERLFEAFATTKEDGMGLGLSICRTIVEAHGGRIWAEAAPGGGTAFHFCVPLADDDPAIGNENV